MNSSNAVKRLIVSSDHAAIELRQHLVKRAENAGFEVKDLGPLLGERVDYPDNASDLALAMKQDLNSIGLLLCGSGIGISMAANRFSHLRAALCTNPWMAKMARLHNDANVLVLGARMIGKDMAEAIFDEFVEVSFEGGRHAARVEKLNKL